MTVLYEKPALNLRSELASLKNQGGYSEQQFWFENLVTNGTFDTNIVGWSGASSTGTGSISWDAGQLSLDSSGLSDRAYADQTITTVIGVTYVFKFSSSVTSVHATIGSLQNNNLTAGDHVISYTATSTSTLLRFAGFHATLHALIDNVSVYETDGTDVIHRMPKGWVPKDVFEDGLLQREGSAHDYEVVYDGFDYYVKPTVAPSATTQTCVIGVRA